MEYPRSRPKAVVQLLAGTFLAVAGVFLALVLPPEWVEVGAVSTTSNVFGWLALAVSPLSLVQGLRAFRDRGPGLRITDEGIEDRSTLPSPGFVAWEDIVGLQPARLYLVGIKVRDWPRMRSRLPLWKRLLSIFTLRFLGSDFHVSSFGVDRSRSDLLRVLRAGWMRSWLARAEASPSPETRTFREPRRRPARTLARIVAIVVMFVALFALDMVRVLGEWQPVDWLPVSLPSWIGKVGLGIVGAIFVGDLVWRLHAPLRIVLGEQEFRYRGITVPWSALEGAYPLARERVAVRLREGTKGAGLRGPVSWLLRAQRRLRGAELVLSMGELGIGAAEFALEMNRRTVLPPASRAQAGLGGAEDG